MVLRSKLLLFGLSLSLAVVSIVRCGHQICVAGIGDCSVTSKTKNKDNLVGDKKFTLEVSKHEIFEGERLEIKAVNIGGDWELRITEGPEGKLEPSGNSAIFVAASSIATSYAWNTLKGKDLSRYKSDQDTPLAFDEIKIKIKKKN